MPQTQEELKILLEKANTLPMRPGVYIMRGAGDKVIYVGKACKLKNRVTQYFRAGEKNVKTQRMVSSVKDFDYYVCDTEIEALTLENTLIKQYTPKYNIRLKDAKSYPYIKIPEGEYPTLTMTRRRENDRGKYFGPYSGVSTVYSVINTLSAVLGLPTCKRKFPRDIGKERPCMYYQIGRCCGVCTGKVAPEEYSEKIKFAVDILRGNTSGVKEELNRKMYEHAEHERYEQAAKCRDTIAALDRLSQKQKVVASPDTEHDIIALYSDDVCTAISVIYVRNGALSDRSDYVFGADRIISEENISAFICEHYLRREYIPKSILLTFTLEEEEATLSEYLSSRSGRRVRVRTPERGDTKMLCDMARDNAKEQAKLYKIENEKDERVLLRLAQLLQLEAYPERIEAYDISNLGKEHITAGMIVTNGIGFKKSDYRSFKIKGLENTTDDYASMREVIDRRLSHLSDGDGSFSCLPDLILLDGGRGHVSVVKELLRERNMTHIPVYGMVKDDFHKTRALCTEDEEISIAKENAVFVFIYKIQEEVHRYTVSKMDSAKRKTLTKSTLTRIKGIGDAKARLLLKTFGGLAGVKSASVEELMSVSGINLELATAIKEYFKKQEK